MPSQAIPIDLPLSWDFALPIGPALIVALLAAVLIAVVLTLSVALTAESTDSLAGSTLRPSSIGARTSDGRASRYEARSTGSGGSPGGSPSLADRSRLSASAAGITETDARIRRSA